MHGTAITKDLDSSVLGPACRRKKTILLNQEALDVADTATYCALRICKKTGSNGQNFRRGDRAFVSASGAVATSAMRIFRQIAPEISLCYRPLISSRHARPGNGNFFVLVATNIYMSLQN